MFSLQRLLTAWCPLRRNSEVVTMRHPITEQGLAVAVGSCREMKEECRVGAAQTRRWGGGRREHLAFIAHLLYALSVHPVIRLLCRHREPAICWGARGVQRSPPPAPQSPEVQLLTLGHTAGSGVELRSVSRPFCFESPGIAF